jgi:DNA (cytosine-5)-methyltransferase 1
MNNASSSTNKIRTTRHLSLCSGIGGIDLGLKRVVENLRTVAYVEGEAFAAANLVAKMEQGELDSALVYSDLRVFPWKRYRGLVDLISGGFPCQPFSSAGKRNAVEDDRHLWPHIKKGIRFIRPRAVFFENVDGIASCKSPGYHSVLHNVLCDLEELGYRPEAGVFTAAEVGAPHIRRRWFILAVANSYFGGQQEFCQAHDEDREDARRDEPGGRSKDVANTRHLCGEISPEGEHTTEQFSGSYGSSWPARPGERQRSGEPPRTVVMRMGGDTDGIQNRVDRLRALGNSCIPDVAALAFSSLWQRIAEDKP